MHTDSRGASCFAPAPARYLRYLFAVLLVKSMGILK
jgi:hypothetical protein